MELRQYARMLRRHWLLIAGAVLLCTLSAAILTAQAPPIYQSGTKLLVFSRAAGSNLGESYQGDLLAQARVKTYADLVRSPAVLQGVIERLRLPDSVGGLQSRVSVELPEDTTLITVTVDAESPARARDTAEALAEEFSQYVAGVEQARARSVNDVRVTPVQAATMPAGPIAPHHVLDLVLGVLAGLAAGVAAAVLREHFNGRIRDAADVARVTEAPAFGTGSGRRWSVRRRAGPGRSTGEAHRDLASVLLRLQENRGGGPIVVLGVTRDSGGSEIVTKVARALARSPLRVVLITPTAPDSWPGLFDVLAGRVPVGRALQQAEDEPWLMFLSAGASGTDRPALDPRPIAKLIADLHEWADVVLFDPPPLDESVDGALLAAYCDGALLVVRPGHTRRKALARAIERLEDLSTAPRAVLLNSMARSAAADGALGG